MEKEGPLAISDHPTQQNPEKNPRRAATKLKEMQLNLEMMRNRFKVIEGKDQYSRYRTLDHSKRIDIHNSIHSTIEKEKEELKKTMEERAEIADIKMRNDQLRTQIKKNIAESRKVMLNERMERSQLIADEFARNEQRIKQLKEKDYEENKTRRSLVLQQEEQKRTSLKKHYENKIKSTLWEKEKASSNLNKEVNTLHQELSLMMELEKKLNEQYSKSLQASHTMKSKYNQMVNLSQRSVSEKLPEVKGPGGVRSTPLSEGR